MEEVRGMKKILPVILILVVLGGGVYFFLIRGKGQSGVGNLAKSEIYEGTLKMAVEKGIPLKCAWRKDDGNFGTTWVKGKNIYGELTAEGKEGYMIMKDNCIWSWAKGESVGAKICFEEIDYDQMSSGTGSTTGTSTASVPDQQFNCVPSVITESKFEPPSEVNFSSF